MTADAAPAEHAARLGSGIGARYGRRCTWASWIG